ncbi:MAG TPA: adenylate/guanylate cyclase domain-containing protein [Myxococcota bacterium]|nr:adenylate/guanylate cyclase domain-containing protein [Myxococcota bacterium]
MQSSGATSMWTESRLAGAAREFAPAVDVTLLFSDVARSTELTEALGDHAAYGLIDRYWQMVHRWAVRYGGEELEFRGDGVLLAFTSSAVGLECAIAIQRTLAGGNETGGNRLLSVRMGLHSGCAIRSTRGYFGRTVILSARIADQAKPDEILVSAELRGRVEGARFVFDEGRHLALKGFRECSHVFGVVWHSHELRLEDAEAPRTSRPECLHSGLPASSRRRDMLPGGPRGACARGNP